MKDEVCLLMMDCGWQFNLFNNFVSSPPVVSREEEYDANANETIYGFPLSKPILDNVGLDSR